MSKKLKILADHLIAKYGFFKVAVPLEDDRVRIAPGWRHPSKKNEDPKENYLLDKKIIKEERNEARKMIRNKTYARHYGKTNIRYNIIYVPDFLTLVGEIYEKKSFPVETFRQLIDKKINRFVSDIKSHKDAEMYSGSAQKDLETDKLILQCLHYLKVNLKADCVNILANRFDDDDALGPAAIDHDIGHKILDFFSDSSLEGIDHLMKNVDPEDLLFHAFLKDYRFYSSEGEEIVDFGKESDQSVLQKSKKFFRKAFERILAKSIALPGSISYDNMRKGDMVDLIYDIVVAYNFRGEDLGEITLNGEDITYQKITAKPIDPSLPNMNAEMKKFVQLSNKLIGQRLSGLVGKVFFLW